MAKVDPFEKLLRVILNSYGLNCRGIKDFLSGAKENNYQIIGIVTYAEVKKLKPQKCDCLLFKTEYVDQYSTFDDDYHGYIYYPLSSKELLMVSYYC
jgi:hypothetical protein